MYRCQLCCKQWWSTTSCVSIACALCFSVSNVVWVAVRCSICLWQHRFCRQTFSFSISYLITIIVLVLSHDYVSVCLRWQMFTHICVDETYWFSHLAHVLSQLISCLKLGLFSWWWAPDSQQFRWLYSIVLHQNISKLAMLMPNRQSGYPTWIYIFFFFFTYCYCFPTSFHKTPGSFRPVKGCFY